jgi:thiol-disulfide isomerase/thioredoxin
MQVLLRFGGLSLFALLLFAASAAPQAPAPGDVTLKTVKYDDLCDLITKNRGKVILLDFYTKDCLPCKQAFPHIVEMNRKYADKGLVTISVSLDPWSDEFKAQHADEVLAHLKKTDARFTNLMLNESGAFIGERLRIKTVPFIYVFDRQGRWTAFPGERLGEKKEFFTDNKVKYYKYTEVEDMVQKLLEK